MILGFAVSVAVIAAVTGAHFSGLWIPNHPSRAEFPVQGIDVSRHQGPIQWSIVPTNDIQFVYIKATEGGDFRDERFAENWESSGKAGLRRGAYHFFTFKTPGAKQADNFIATVPKESPALPPAVDVEYSGNTHDLPSVDQFQHELSAYISKVRDFYGREPVIYAAQNFQNHYLGGFPQPRLWFRTVVASPRVFGVSDWTFWQFTEKARVRGIDGFVDRNVFRGSQDEFEKFCLQRP